MIIIFKSTEPYLIVYIIFRFLFKNRFFLFNCISYGQTQNNFVVLANFNSLKPSFFYYSFSIPRARTELKIISNQHADLCSLNWHLSTKTKLRWSHFHDYCYCSPNLLTNQRTTLEILVHLKHISGPSLSLYLANSF